MNHSRWTREQPRPRDSWLCSAPPIDVALAGVTITGGRATDPYDGGGGINAGWSTVTIRDSVITRNIGRTVEASSPETRS